MNTFCRFLSIIACLLLAACGGPPAGIDPQLFSKYEAGNEKLGQVYYEQVCSRCHKVERGEPVSPADKLSTDWDQLFAADIHVAGNEAGTALSEFFSQDYRQQIAPQVEAARVYASVPADELKLGLYKFVIMGAKDSDRPHSCND